jgi:cleavage and polyadenylation specificity factor subunit 6/7
VKFFENRANGQSKGFCVVSLGSEQSMRMVMDRLPKKELHGQNAVVTLPTKQALNQFESQQKTRPTPPAPGQPNGPRTQGPGPGNMGGMPMGMGMGGPGPQRMMNPQGMRGPVPPHMQMPQHMQGPPGQGPPRPQVCSYFICVSMHRQWFSDL